MNRSTDFVCCIAFTLPSSAKGIIYKSHTMGRPRETNRFPGATIRGFKMDGEDSQALDAAAKKLKLTKSDTMRMAIRQLAEKLGVQPTKAA